jgi:hypothetical protein
MAEPDFTRALKSYQQDRRQEWQLSLERRREVAIEVHTIYIDKAKKAWTDKPDSPRRRHEYTGSVLDWALWRDTWEAELKSVHQKLGQLDELEKKALILRPTPKDGSVKFLSDPESKRSRSPRPLWIRPYAHTFVLSGSENLSPAPTTRKSESS